MHLLHPPHHITGPLVNWTSQVQFHMTWYDRCIVKSEAEFISRVQSFEGKPYVVLAQVTHAPAARDILVRFGIALDTVVILSAHPKHRNVPTSVSFAMNDESDQLFNNSYTIGSSFIIFDVEQQKVMCAVEIGAHDPAGQHMFAHMLSLYNLYRRVATKAGDNRAQGGRKRGKSACFVNIGTRGIANVQTSGGNVSSYVLPLGTTEEEVEQHGVLVKLVSTFAYERMLRFAGFIRNIFEPYMPLIAQRPLSDDVPMHRMHLSRNAPVKVHLDASDCDGTLITWTHSNNPSDAQHMGGGFCLYELMLKWHPTKVTSCYIRSGELWHGSMAPQAAGTRMGMALCNNRADTSRMRHQNNDIDAVPVSTKVQISGACKRVKA